MESPPPWDFPSSDLNHILCDIHSCAVAMISGNILKPRTGMSQSAAWTICLGDHSQLLCSPGETGGNRSFPTILRMVSNTVVNRLFINDSCFFLSSSSLFLFFFFNGTFPRPVIFLFCVAHMGRKLEILTSAFSVLILPMSFSYGPG